MSICPCPITAFTTVPYDQCAFIFDKDARWAFQRLDDTNNEFVSGVNGIELAASWSAQPDASDSTKVVVTPFLEDVTFGEEDTLEDGENFDGAANTVAPGPQPVTAMVRNPRADEKSALSAMSCEPGTLTFYRFFADSQIGARLISTSPDTHAGIKISRKTFLVKDPSRGGAKVDQNKMQIQFQLAAGWFDAFSLTTPETGFVPYEDVKPS